MARYSTGLTKVKHQAVLNGTLDDCGGEVCDVRLEWGETISYGDNTPWRSGKPTGDNFSHTLKGLKYNTTYHFKAQAKNSIGTSDGADQTFTT